MEIAMSTAQALDVVLMGGAKPDARASTPTWSTPVSPCSHLINEALLSAAPGCLSRAGSSDGGTHRRSRSAYAQLDRT
jgi:hypothetical protein